MMSRLCLATIAALALADGDASAPSGAGGAPNAVLHRAAPTPIPTPPPRPLWRVVRFHGRDHDVPPGVLALSADVLLFGHVEVEVPDGVDFSFNQEGQAVFTLADHETPRAWTLRVGANKYVAGARSRLIVPLPAVGRPRFESTPFPYRVVAPREFLDQAYDLGDPLDASPFR